MNNLRTDYLFGDMQFSARELYYLRAFAILAILLVHVTAAYRLADEITSPVVFAAVINVFSVYAVPLFIAIAGFYAKQVYSNHYSLRKYYLREPMRILPALLIFAFLYLLLGIYLGYIDDLGKVSLDSLYYTYVVSGGYAHLWFIVILLQFYIIYPLIQRVYSYFASIRREYLLLIFAFILQYLWKIIGSGLYIELGEYTVYLAKNLFLFEIFYFVFGIWVASNYTLIKGLFAMIMLPDVCGGSNEVSKDVVTDDKFKSMLKASIGSGIALTYGVLKLFMRYRVKCSLFVLLCMCILSFSILLLEFGNFIHYKQFEFVSLYAAAIEPFIMLFCIIMMSVLYTLSAKFVSERSFRWVYAVGTMSFGIYLINPFAISILNQTIFREIGLDYNDFLYYPIMFVSALVLSVIVIRLIRYLPFDKYILAEYRD